MNDLKQKFDEARQFYPGTRRGLEPEWELFRQVCKKHRLRQSEVVPLLKPAIESQIETRITLKENGRFVPEWKNFKTWIYQQCWTEEPPAMGKSCVVCGATENLVRNLDMKNNDVWICPKDLENIKRYDPRVNWARLPASHIKRLAELGAER